MTIDFNFIATRLNDIIWILFIAGTPFFIISLHYSLLNRVKYLRCHSCANYTQATYTMQQCIENLSESTN